MLRALSWLTPGYVQEPFLVGSGVFPALTPVCQCFRSALLM